MHFTRASNSLLQAAAALLLLSTSAFGHGAYHDELQRSNEEIVTRPNDGSLLFHRAYLYVLHGEWQMALADLENADRLEPGRYATDWLRGQALTAGGQFEAGKTVLDDFLTQYPEHGGALASRARVLDKLEQHEAALVDFRSALMKTPNAEPDLVMEVAEALVAQKHIEEAADLIDAHLLRLGHSPGLIIKALELEVAIGRFDAALSRVDAMQKTEPRPEPWMAKRASVLAQAGRLKDSQEAWQALFAHIQALPNLERGSHAMQLIAEQTQQALAALHSLSTNTTQLPKP